MCSQNNQFSQITKRFFSKKQNYYQILGVAKSASLADVKKAYAKLAREFHPDKNSATDAKQKFSEINEAYATLNDEKKRQIYDQTGITGDEQKQYSNAGYSNEVFDFSDFFSYQSGKDSKGYENLFRDFEDIFGSENQKSNKRSHRGSDVQVAMEVEFYEAVNGVTKQFSYKAKDICNLCKGSKCKPGTSPSKCTTCSGRGTVNYRQGPMHIQMGCSQCKTTGNVIKNPCLNCKGSGCAQNQITEKIDVPPGINNEQVLRVSGRGNIGDNGGIRGDLLIKILIKVDSYFKREHYDVITEVPISIHQAVLGGPLDIKTLSGTKKIHILAGTTNGTKIKLGGEGISKLAPNQNQRGDHFVIFNVTVPKNLTPDLKKVYELLKLIDENKGIFPKHIFEKEKSFEKNDEEKKREDLFQSFEPFFSK